MILSATVFVFCQFTDFYFFLFFAVTIAGDHPILICLFTVHVNCLNHSLFKLD